MYVIKPKVSQQKDKMKSILRRIQLKRKFSRILGVGLTLALLASMLVTATPVAANHTSDAVIDFAVGASAVAGEDSILDVTVTNDVASAGDIKRVKIDFSVGDFTVIGAGVAVAGWTPSLDGDVVTYTADTAGDYIAPEAWVTFSPAVTNPVGSGEAAVPAVKTTDTGSQAAFTATDAEWISYIADSVGIGGNTITVDYVDPGYPDRDLSVSVADQAITVSLATDGDSVLTSTASEVTAAITAEPAAAALVDATADVDHLEYVVLAATVSLTGGTSPQVDVDCDETPATLTVYPSFAVTATPTPATSAATASYDIEFTTITAIAAETGTIVITFAEGYDLTSLDLTPETGDVTMTEGINPYVPSDIAVVGQVLTITAHATTPILGDVAVVITIANVGNPPASGDYDINVAGADPDTDADTVTIVPDAFEVVAGALDTVTAGTPFVVTLQALNALAADDTGYISDHYIDFAWVGGPTGATIPGYELITFTAGEGTSPANFILTTTGESITITATDLVVDFTGDSGAITINPGALGSFTITDVATTEAGAVFGSVVTVSAFDAEGNAKTDYTGIVTWSSTDTGAGATLPVDYTFTGVGEDNGVHDFLAADFILVTVGEGTQTITVADGAVEASDEITVTPAAADYLTAVASVDFLVADGTDTSAITASARDEFGNVADEAITFVTNLGVFVESGTATHTAGAGEGVANLKSSELGTATIKVTSDTLTTPITLTVDLVGTAVVDDLTVSVVKTIDINEYTITATYVDALGKTVTPADGDVTFSTDPAVIDPATETPSSGVATLAAFTTTLALGETINVTATGMGLTGTAVITVGVYTTDPIELEAGWNLISLPLIPDDSAINAVLAGITDGTVEQVRTWDQVWHNWASTPPEPSNLITDMEDGQGYWVASAEGGTLEVSGYELCGPFPALPPSYDVVSGWNLIGYTSITSPGDIETYLGEVALGTNLQAIYGFDASSGLYDIPATLEPGCGYWIALTLGGTIYP